MRRRTRSLWVAALALFLLQPLFAQIAISVAFGPPALPVYEQPICPGDGYLWAPGYWNYGPDYGYYWVPGTWVLAPQPGYLWTPAWWGWGGSAFIFHQGYWATSIGFYGGINYGFGYFGNGYEGGRWQGDHFYYNRSVTNVNVTNIHNVYNTRVVNNVTNNHISYNGGQGGLTARPTAAQQAVARGQHLAPVAAQMQHVQTARANPQLRASMNHGVPPIAATERPGSFTGRNAIPARSAGAPYKPAPSHGGELPTHQPATPPPSGNAQLDAQHQQQQQQLAARQNQEHQQLQQQQAAEHQQAEQQHASQAAQQQMEQQHAQQTMHMEQQHMQQQQQMEQQQRMAMPAGPRGGGAPHR